MTDSQIIDQLGGAAKVAELLGFDKKQGGVQRVHNWRARGIPSAVRLQHREIFNGSPTANQQETRNAA